MLKKYLFENNKIEAKKIRMDINKERERERDRHTQRERERERERREREEREREKERERDRQTDRQTDRQIDRQTVGNKDIKNRESYCDTEREKVLKWKTRKTRKKRYTR